MFIYLITNKINGKQYIGKTKRDVNKRIIEHINANTYIGRAIRKYSLESFNISIIDSSVAEDVLDEKEKYWIKFYDCKSPNGYNLTDGGEGLHGHTFSKKHRRKLSEVAKGNKRRLGCVHSEETKAKFSIDRRGKPGRPHSDEFKARMIGNKYGHNNKGVELSEEHKKKISKALMGNKNGIHSIEGRTRMIGNKYASKVKNVSING